MAETEPKGMPDAEVKGTALVPYRSSYEIERAAQRAAQRARRRRVSARWEERMQRRLLLILRVAAEAYEVEPEALTRRTKVQVVCRSRTLYCILARRLVRTLTGVPVPTTMIGLTIERDHTTVLHHLGLGEHLMVSTGSNGGEERFREAAGLAMTSLSQLGVFTEIKAPYIPQTASEDASG